MLCRLGHTLPVPAAGKYTLLCIHQDLQHCAALRTAERLDVPVVSRAKAMVCVRVCSGVCVQGAPFNIKDFKVLLDAQVYEDLEGRWVDLFNRMKWDIIKSVLKSVAGLQGRKFKVTCTPPPPPPHPAPKLTLLPSPQSQEFQEPSLLCLSPARKPAGVFSISQGLLVCAT